MRLTRTVTKPSLPLDPVKRNYCRPTRNTVSFTKIVHPLAYLRLAGSPIHTMKLTWDQKKEKKSLLRPWSCYIRTNQVLQCVVDCVDALSHRGCPRTLLSTFSLFSFYRLSTACAPGVRLVLFNLWLFFLTTLTLPAYLSLQEQ